MLVPLPLQVHQQTGHNRMFKARDKLSSTSVGKEDDLTQLQLAQDSHRGRKDAGRQDFDAVRASGGTRESSKQL